MTDKQLEKYIVSPEVAKELKEIGFDEPCLGYYDSDGEFSQFSYYESERTNSDFNDIHPEYNRESTAPLLDQVFDWFEEKCIFGLLSIRHISGSLPTWKYSFHVKSNEFPTYFEDNTYLRAWQAKQACIEKMIEIYKTIYQ